MELEQLHLAGAEHDAWLALAVTQLRGARGIDLNEDEALHAAIVLWGERLVALRKTQDDETITRAREEAEKLYGMKIGFLP